MSGGALSRVATSHSSIMSLAAALLKASSGFGTASGCPHIDWRGYVGDDRQLDWILREAWVPCCAGRRRTARMSLRIGPGRFSHPTSRREFGMPTCCDGRGRARHLPRPPCRGDPAEGISVADRLYPAAHMRPMGDVDVLAPADDEQKVAEALLACGFERIPYPDTPGQHHGAPLRHVRRRTLLELHTAPFPASARVRGAAIFIPAHLHAHKQVSSYHGRNAGHLTDEVQLAYIAASWFNHMTTFKFHPSFLASLFDAARLSGRMGRRSTGTRSCDRSTTVRSRRLVLRVTYAARFWTRTARFALRRLAENRGLVGPVQRRFIHAALDRYLLGARVWSLPLPPPMPGRYSPRHQFEKRLMRR